MSLIEQKNYHDAHRRPPMDSTYSFDEWDVISRGFSTLRDEQLKAFDALGITEHLFLRINENPDLDFLDFFFAVDEVFMDYERHNIVGGVKRWKKNAGIWKIEDAVILMMMPCYHLYEAVDIKAFKNVNKNIDDIIRYISKGYELSTAAKAHNAGLDPELIDILSA